LPLAKGSLESVPIEEHLGGAADEMDVDDDGTQRPKEVADWGVEPNFDDLEDEDREVSCMIPSQTGRKLTPNRIARKRSTASLRDKSPSSKRISRSSSPI
jgi:hypothetical protein